MHSYEATNGTVFHYNADFSGDITIYASGNRTDSYEISGEDILEFVAYQYVASERITMIEQMLSCYQA